MPQTMSSKRQRISSEIQSEPTDADTQSTLPSVTLGPRLPAELTRMVVQQAQTAYSKGGLAAMSLTCCDWATVVRPRLFRKLKLCTPVDIAQLLEFLESRTPTMPALTKCIRHLQYGIYEDQVPPWIRLHKLSKVIPGVDITLDVYGQQSLGASLLKSLPRTLPPSIFRFRSIELSGLAFKKIAEFAPLFHNTAKLEDFVCIDLTVQQEMTQNLYFTRVPHRRHALTCDASGSWHDIDKVDGSFSAQFNFGCAMILPAHRLGLDKESWTSAIASFIALVPEHFICDKLSVAGNASDPSNPPCIRFNAHNGDKAFAVSLVWRLAQKEYNIDVHGDVEGEDTSTHPTYPGWNHFEKIFLQGSFQEPLRLSIEKSEPILKAIMEDKILAKVQNAGRLLLTFNGKTVTKDMAKDTPAEYTVDGFTFILDTYERLRLAACKDADEREQYLRRLASERREPQLGPQPPAVGGVDSLEEEYYSLEEEHSDSLSEEEEASNSSEEDSDFNVEELDPKGRRR